MNEILVLDTETSGLSSKVNGICEIFMKVKGIDTGLHIYVKPVEEMIYDDRAFAVNGLSLEFLEENGIEESLAVDKIIKFILKEFQDKPKLLGQNVIFDINFLEAMFQRHDLSFKKTVHYNFVDTMQISNFLKDCGVMPKTVKSKLTEAYKFFTEKNDEDIKGAHTAAFDVMMTETLYDKQLECIKNNNFKYK